MENVDGEDGDGGAGVKAPIAPVRSDWTPTCLGGNVGEVAGIVS